MEEYVAKCVAEAPPFTAQQINGLRQLLGKEEWPEPEYAPRESAPIQSTRPNRYIPKAVRAEILAKPCAYCGARATQVDHVVPLGKGGRHRRDNWAPACAPCNFDKGELMLEDWELIRYAS